MSHTDGKGNVPKLYSTFHGEVASLQAYGAFVKIPGCKRQGLVHKSQMSSARIEDPSEMLSKGEMVYCKVIAFEGEGEKISLSMKVVNQTTGQDLDPNNVQMDQDAKKRRQWKHIGKDRIELGAELNTTCRRCGGHGHLTMDCFAGKDGTQYELIPDLDTLTALPPPVQLSHSQHKKKKKKKDKKKKKKTKKKKRHSSSSSASSASEDDVDSQAHIRHKGSQSHPQRERSPKSFNNGPIRTERRTSDKRSRSVSSPSEHSTRDGRDKIRRKDDSDDPSDESSTLSAGHGRRQRSDQTGAAKSRGRDSRQPGQGHVRKGRGHEDCRSVSSDDSPPPKHRSKGADADGHRRSSRRDSDDDHGQDLGRRGKSKNSPRELSEDEGGVRMKQNVHKRSRDSFDERSKNVGESSHGERLTSTRTRHREDSPERAEPRKVYDNERRRRSRSSSRDTDRKKKKHQKRSSS